MSIGLQYNDVSEYLRVCPKAQDVPRVRKQPVPKHAGADHDMDSDWERQLRKKDKVRRLLPGWAIISFEHLVFGSKRPSNHCYGRALSCF